MRTILMSIYFVILVLAFLVPAKHALHMFQQNRYEVKRYYHWVMENWKAGMKRALIPFLMIVLAGVLSFLLRFEQVLVLCIIAASFLAYRQLRKEFRSEYIKPLVFTGRVKRQILVMAILTALILGIASSYPGRIYCMSTLGFCYFGAWLLIFPVAWITSPIEHAVQHWYINDAKKQLESHSNLIKIGITGSYGKTSTKNVIQAIMAEQFNSLMTPASYNTPMGITRTVREMLKPIHQVFVCEMGADKVGDITELMEFVQPTVGVVTSIGPQHLSTFHTQENITKEKMQIIEKLPPDGIGVLNYDNEFIRNYKVQNPVKCITYGIRTEGVDYRAVDIQYTATGSAFTVVHEEERIPFETRLLGELNILNILSAIICARSFQIPWQTIQVGVRKMAQVEHRLEMRKINGYSFIDDAFNANPSGAKMALDVMERMPGKRIIVTPGMIELGERQEEINKAFGMQMKGKVDEVILVGQKQTRPIYVGLMESGFHADAIHVVGHVKEAFQYIYQNTKPEDTTILLENDLPDAFSH